MPKDTRNYFHTIPEGGLIGAGSVMLDWNISSRLTTLYRAREEGRRHGLQQAVLTRLRWLADNIPPEATIISGLSAAEPELRPKQSEVDLLRYTERSVIASLMLNEGSRHLRELLDNEAGGHSQIPLIQSTTSVEDFATMRNWMFGGYAALLKAAYIYTYGSGTQKEKTDEYRFWLEYQLCSLPSREVWLGFLLLGGSGDYPQRVARLLKLHSSTPDPMKNIWGAAWDVSYTRIGAMAQQSSFLNTIPTPVIFVTDDDGLANVMTSISLVGTIRGLKSSEFNAELMDGAALSTDAAPIVDDFVARSRSRIAARSRGATETVLRRARSCAARVETDFKRQQPSTL